MLAGRMFYQRQYAYGYCTATLHPGSLVIHYAYDRRPTWMSTEDCPRMWGMHVLRSLENPETV